MHLEKILTISLAILMQLIKVLVFAVTVIVLSPILLIGLWIEITEWVADIHY